MGSPAQPDPSLERLNQALGGVGRLLVAYSGGVDSAFLAWAAHQKLGAQMRAVIADSPSLARTHLEDALAFARETEIPLEVIETRELENGDYVRNDAMRCFHCKDELFTVMERYRAEHGFDAIAYGVNTDDQGDFRPGQEAARQHHILSHRAAVAHRLGGVFPVTLLLDGLGVLWAEEQGGIHAFAFGKILPAGLQLEGRQLGCERLGGLRRLPGWMLFVGHFVPRSSSAHTRFDANAASLVPPRRRSGGCGTDTAENRFDSQNSERQRPICGK